MAFSLHGKLWLSFYAIGEDAALDKQHADLVASKIGALRRHGMGIQLADENLAGRPDKFMATQHFRRLESIRRRYDPKGMFHSYMRIPIDFQKFHANI